MARPASIYIIRNKCQARRSRRGFTLVELMLASVLSAIVFAALFSAYIFLARSLTRMANFQQQQVQNRRAMYVVAKDVSEAVKVNSAQPDTVTLTLFSGDVITYTYTPPLPDPPTVPGTIPGTLTRKVNGATPAPILLANLTSFIFNYFDKNGAGSPPLVFIKQIQMTYTSAVGDKPNFTQSADKVVSASMVLRGKPPLGQ